MPESDPKMNHYSEKLPQGDFLLTKALRRDKFFRLNGDSMG